MLPLSQHYITTLELFAGAGGLAIGLERAGLHCILFNDHDRHACDTLKKNRPQWHVIKSDVSQIDFSPYKGKVDVIAGGFPCQTFSYAGKRLGFNDARGTLFYEFARAVHEAKPLVCVGENVKGLLNHDNGKTIQGMVSVLNGLGYDVLPPRVLKAVLYRVPQKRERVLIVGLKRGAGLKYAFPCPHETVFTLKDALKKGPLFDCDVPLSAGQLYPTRKKEILQHVPAGGCWRDLPIALQREHLQKSFYASGGKTGMARRLHWDAPCLTVTCCPAQKQTERCHPVETRPLTVREYARIQTFPDNWDFAGPLSSQYKQIGNAVPVNLATEIGCSLVRCLEDYYARPKQRVLATPKNRSGRKTTVRQAS